MAFKMNGSPAKMGTIQGTTGHSSVLKQKMYGGKENKKGGIFTEAGRTQRKINRSERTEAKLTKNANKEGFDTKKSSKLMDKAKKRLSKTPKLYQNVKSGKTVIVEKKRDKGLDDLKTKIAKNRKKFHTGYEEMVYPKDGDMKKYSDLEKYDDDKPKTIAKQIKVDDNRYPKPNFEIHSREVDLSKKSGFGPSTAFGGVKNPELIKAKKTKGKKVMKDGKKTNVVHKGKMVEGNWQPHQFKK